MKKILALLLAMMMVFALCACGGGSDAADDTADAPEAPAADDAADADEAPEAPAEGGASGEPSGEGSGEPSGEKADAEADYEITVDGVTGTAHYQDTDNGDESTKGFEITFDGKTIPGSIDKGVWTADDAADQAVVDAVQAAFEGGNTVGPQQ